MKSDLLVAVSLKAYLRLAQTRGWLHELAVTLANDSLPPGVELAVHPSFPFWNVPLELEPFGAKVG